MTHTSYWKIMEHKYSSGATLLHSWRAELRGCKVCLHAMEMAGTDPGVHR